MGRISEKTDLNWLFSMVAFILLCFSSFPLSFSGAATCVSCFLCFMNPQKLLLLSCMVSYSCGDIMLVMSLYKYFVGFVVLGLLC